LDDALRARGRSPDEFTLSIMTTCIIGSDESELRRRVQEVLARTNNSKPVDDYIAEASKQRLVGTTDQVIERLHRYAKAGVGRVMLQHLYHQDLAMVELIGSDLVPALA
jgi:alkanesulfonate monooxygenase SsuD/methylene tetrahydromethanopterin reductase-like flavin-dependent oxidoreductase (luciferase family)